MNARGRIVAVWAGLCLAGLGATLALNTPASTDESESPTREPMLTGTQAFDCQEIAASVEEARAEAGRERREAVGSSPTAAYQSVIVGDVAVPEECADEIEDLGVEIP
ncbi:hypothetical protein [Streptomyces violarus]|uniref:hypothetical protein n=1 Tax=Streptomyces violarus TaxID=67380 RepID=UPI0021C19737|nr:hypothetical protein [Streptomyces violarus]MCT9137915.1 hypothetical protein [Streptomyces violarus]